MRVIPVLSSNGGGNDAMKTLNFSDNKIEQIPKWTFINYRNLENLDLSQNKIQTMMPGTLSENKKLKYLNLEANNFNSLPFKARTPQMFVLLIQTKN